MAKDEPDRQYSFEHNLNYGVPNDEESDFLLESFKDSISNSKYDGYMHAAHAMIYCLHKDLQLWERYKQPASILMQSRCDGNLGFPGGLLDKTYKESVVEGLNRELAEEIGLDLATHALTQADHLTTHVVHRKKLILHFYVREVSEAQYRSIERQVPESEEWGSETFGIVRVPLFAMEDGSRGLPLFLANQFAGNARNQLLTAIKELQILSQIEVETFLESFRSYTRNKQV